MVADLLFGEAAEAVRRANRHFHIIFGHPHVEGLSQREQGSMYAVLQLQAFVVSILQKRLRVHIVFPNSGCLPREVGALNSQVGF